LPGLYHSASRSASLVQTDHAVAAQRQGRSGVSGDDYYLPPARDQLLYPSICVSKLFWIPSGIPTFRRRWLLFVEMVCADVRVAVASRPNKIRQVACWIIFWQVAG
jgi:hypothetical protein